jgi:hypothetical protein
VLQGGADRVVWRVFSGFDQIFNHKISSPPPKKKLAGEVASDR